MSYSKRHHTRHPKHHYKRDAFYKCIGFNKESCDEFTKHTRCMKHHSLYLESVKHPCESCGRIVNNKHPMCRDCYQESLLVDCVCKVCDLKFRNRYRIDTCEHCKTCGLRKCNYCSKIGAKYVAKYSSKRYVYYCTACSMLRKCIICTNVFKPPRGSESRKCNDCLHSHKCYACSTTFTNHGLAVGPSESSSCLCKECSYIKERIYPCHRNGEVDEKFHPDLMLKVHYESVDDESMIENGARWNYEIFRLPLGYINPDDIDPTGMITDLSHNWLESFCGSHGKIIDATLFRPIKL